MSGDERRRAIYERFIEPHPRFKVIQRKRWGVALLRLPDQPAQYLKGKPREALRTNRNRCLGLGYRFGTVDPLARLDDILAVHRSIPERQGRPMDSSYLDPAALRDYFTTREKVFAVLDANGTLKAYAEVLVVGEVAILNRLMGHGDALENGVMYLCISEAVLELSQRRRESGQPVWLSYDTFFGGSPGLRYFKERLGFRPYKVRWVWASEDPPPK